MAVFYVTGPPLVEHGDGGNVLVTYLAADDVVTLAFRTDENYQSLMEVQDRGYALSSAERSRRLYPELPWDGIAERSA